MITETSDLQFLNNPGAWPMWPACPVKRTVECNLQCGCVFEGKPIVFMVYVFDMSPEKIKAAKKYEYTSFEELLQDGWMVD